MTVFDDQYIKKCIIVYRHFLYMFLQPTKMDIQFMEMFQKCSKRCALRYLGKSVDILWETLAAIAKLAIGTRNVGVGIVDVA